MNILIFNISALAIAFFVCILDSLLGALVGWTVGLLFSDTVLGILKQIGIENVSMWQVGLFLGFVSSFFKQPTSNTDN